MNEHPDAFRDWDSAYVLGMLSPEDRRLFEQHLATCAACSAAVADLAGVPGILSALSAAEAVALTLPPDDDHLRAGLHEPDLVQRLAATVVRRRRSVRIRVGAFILASAAVLGFGGLVVGSTIADHRPAPPSVAVSPEAAPLRTMSEVVPGAMTARLAVTAKGWGTRFDWNCTYLVDDWTSAAPAYDLVITGIDGSESTVATWRATKSTAGGLVASSAVATADIRSVEIRSGGVTLVRSTL
jgi:hypothetical protein